MPVLALGYAACVIGAALYCCATVSPILCIPLIALAAYIFALYAYPG